MFLVSKTPTKEKKMKKLLAFVLVVACMLSVCACSTVDPNKKSEGVMTYEQYMAAELEADVVVEAFVQAKQGWWNNQATIYLQDGKGGYLAYNASCTEALYNKLEVGTKVKLTGTKTDYKGEVELKAGATIEIVEGDTWVAPVTDITSVYGTENLVDYQNQKISIKGAKVVAKTDADGNELAFFYNWDNSGIEGTDADLYFDVKIGDKTYTLVIEYYLTNENSDAYKAVQALKVGDTIDVEGFLYWYEGAQPHVTKITVK